MCVCQGAQRSLQQLGEQRSALHLRLKQLEDDNQQLHTHKQQQQQELGHIMDVLSRFTQRKSIQIFCYTFVSFMLVNELVNDTDRVDSSVFTDVCDREKETASFLRLQVEELQRREEELRREHHRLRKEKDEQEERNRQLQTEMRRRYST